MAGFHVETMADLLAAFEEAVERVSDRLRESRQAGAEAGRRNMMLCVPVEVHPRTQIAA